MDTKPFHIAVSDDALADLHRRLENTRWLPAGDEPGWRLGTDRAFLKELTDYWLHHFDWREQERRLNTLPNYIATVAGLDIHFVHQPGTGPNPMPLVLTHGWPGSFVEMAAIIPLLADPAKYGGDARDAFHVVVPSLPGYGFSAIPRQSGIGPYETAGLWVELMNGLGYGRFGAQGGDIGAGVSSWLARRFPDSLTGVHLNYIPGSYLPALGDGLPPVTGEEQRYLDEVGAWVKDEGAYSHQHGTKPQSLAAGLNDSPAGLAAWIAEKFRSWSDCGGDIRQAISLDHLLTNISLYWFTQTIGSSFRMYVESRRRPFNFQPGERMLPPVGVSHFPKELPTPPRSWVERSYNVRYWNTLPKGGHFAALECPELLAEEIRAFFRPLR